MKYKNKEKYVLISNSGIANISKQILSWEINTVINNLYGYSFESIGFLFSRFTQEVNIKLWKKCDLSKIFTNIEFFMFSKQRKYYDFQNLTHD